MAKVEEDLTTEGVTKKVESYSWKINDIKILAYDSPGLVDGSGKEGDYLEEMYKTCRQGIDLVIFAVSMTGKRFTPDNPDASAMKKFTSKLTPAIWERTLIVLTCANTCEAMNPHLRSKSKEEKEQFFKKLVSDYKTAIHQTLKTTGVPATIAEKVKVVPVGIEHKPELLDGTLWFSNFWFECLTAIPSAKGRAAMIKVNKHRFKKNKEVTDEDLRQPIHNQPITVKTAEERKTLQLLASVGGVMGSAAIGAGIGATGLLAGPVGVVTIPIGLFLGLSLGAVGTALYHHQHSVSVS